MAPIVDDPDAAEALPGSAEVLSALAARLALVAVVSGRPASYLTRHLPDARGVVLAGLYGLERVVDGRVVESDEARRWRPVVAEVADRAEREAPAGVTVERKGSSVALHVRTAPQHAGWIERFAEHAAGGSGLVAHPGRMSVELRPPTGGDKGSVVEELGASLSRVAFLGDDRGDLPAFAALERLRAGGVTTLAVAVDSTEAPAELLAAADVVAAGPAAVLEALRTLLG
ncbi:trehalose-phosphatase [Acidiferrimicrobium sp. IK]|nr:trehalose-phosphatase [Acidiferrimicrobium sp. IK]